jgi:hypothetical protein
MSKATKTEARATLREILAQIALTSAWAPYSELIDAIACSNGHAETVSYDWDEPRVADAALALDLLAGTDAHTTLLRLLFDLWTLVRAGTLYTRSI